MTTEAAATHRYPTPHLPEVGGCGRLAFTLVFDRPPLRHQQVRAHEIEWPDGRKGVRGEELRCGACGGRLDQEAWGRMTAAAVAEGGGQ